MHIVEKELSDLIFNSALAVHRTIGPGLLERVYHECLKYELTQRGVQIESELPIPVKYKGVQLDCGYRLDLVVNNKIIIEVKSVNAIEPIHKAQLLTYLKLYPAQLGILINFNVELLKNGYVRLVL